VYESEKEIDSKTIKIFNSQNGTGISGIFYNLHFHFHFARKPHTELFSAKHLYNCSIGLKSHAQRPSGQESRCQFYTYSYLHQVSAQGQMYKLTAEVGRHWADTPKTRH